MFKLVLEKAEEPEIKLPTCWIIKKAKEFQESIYFCFIDYAKAFVWITINVENSERDGNTRPPDCLLRNLYASQETTVELDMEQTGSK